ncbi:hypothetical protein M9458_015190, partial [Cirrhinus mrigala]
EEFAREFFTVKKQAEAIKYILPQVRVGLRPCTPNNPCLLIAEDSPLQELVRPRSSWAWGQTRPMIKFSQEGGNVSLSAGYQDPSIGFEVEDGQLTYPDPLSRICLRADSHHMVSKEQYPPSLGNLTELRPSKRVPDAETADQDVLGTHLVSPDVGKALYVPWGFLSPGTATFASFSHDIPTPGT